MGPIPLSEIEAAQGRLKGLALRTPLVALASDEPQPSIHLKLENIQHTGAFKLRGAANALALVSPEDLTRGVVTASAGNMAQGLAYVAQMRGVPCRIVVPDQAPATKLDAITRLGATYLPVPFDRWWKTLEDHGHPDVDGHFIHPVADAAIIAGNGTVGLEILEDLPDVETVLLPYGGGGLAVGVASAIKAHRPQTRVIACEVETAAPLSAALQAGRPVTVDRTPSFVDGIGSTSVLQEMWPLVSPVIDGAMVVSLEQIADAIRLLAVRHRVIAEGAGAAAVAAALSGEIKTGPIACVVSGGNIGSSHLSAILDGQVPV